MNKLLIFLLLSFCSCHRINMALALPDDNQIEQKVEKEILDATGVDVDLTPEIPLTDHIA